MIATFATSIKQDTTPHMHTVHEFIVGTRGTALLVAGGKRYLIKSGQTVLVPAGVKHFYAVPQNTSKAIVTFICFDNKPLDRYLSPLLQSRLRSLLGHGVTSAPLDEDTANSNLDLVRMLENTRKSNKPDAREKAGSVLNVILTNHLAAAESLEQPMQSGNYEKIQRTMAWIERHLAEDIDIDAAAAISHMSRSTFTRCFKRYAKTSFNRYVTEARLKCATEFLSQDELPVGDVAFRSGFRNLGHFYSQFQKRFGMTPSQYRRVSLEMISPPTDSSANSARITERGTQAAYNEA